MKKQPQLGLIVEGSAISSAVLRLPGFAAELGPIKSTGLQGARRVSNFLRAGYAVTEYAELQEAKLVLLRVPDAALPRVIEDLCASELVLPELNFVLCESWVLTEALKPLKARGASVASLIAAHGGKRKCFIVEGDLATVRQIRRILGRTGARTVELRTGAKSLYFAADLFASALPIPLLLIAQQALRDSGVAGNHLWRLMDEMGREMLDSFLRGARGPWGGPLTQCSPETAQTHLQSLAADHPELARLLDEQLTWARRRVSKRARGHSA
jgi:predicted short-subunit dehydrogenase-like oxidoreductase (DUF2520 family)